MAHLCDWQGGRGKSTRIDFVNLLFQAGNKGGRRLRWATAAARRKNKCGKLLVDAGDRFGQQRGRGCGVARVFLKRGSSESKLEQQKTTGGVCSTAAAAAAGTMKLDPSEQKETDEEVSLSLAGALVPYLVCSIDSRYRLCLRLFKIDLDDVQDMKYYILGHEEEGDAVRKDQRCGQRCPEASLADSFLFVSARLCRCLAAFSYFWLANTVQHWDAAATRAWRGPNRSTARCTAI